MVAALVRCLSSIVIAIVLATTSAGCVVVRAHQREALSKRAMTNDRDEGEVRFGQHERGSREGADGGTGQPGGGCGCN
jgi:hypothetical protein